jgi:hypothetical protein
MKVVNCFPSPPQNSLARLMRQLSDLQKFGSEWVKDLPAQEVFIAHTDKLLDNKHTLLRNVVLSKGGMPIPLVLVSPSGIHVIYTSTLKGVYRAKDDTWAVMDNRSQRFDAASPNLVRRVLLMAEAISVFLLKHNQQIEVEPVLFLSQPGIHVDTIRPAVRVVLTDAVDRFIAGIIQSRPILNVTTLEYLVSALSQHTTEQLKEAAPPPGKATIASGKRAVRAPGFRLTRPQWLVLGGMLVLEILIIVISIWIILL